MYRDHTQYTTSLIDLRPTLYYPDRYMHVQCPETYAQRRECALGAAPPGSSSSLPTTWRDWSAWNACGACSSVYLQVQD
jgi:hypothetical protein